MKGVNNKERKILLAGMLMIFLTTFSTYAQQAKAKIDRDTIKIGEQINYTMEIEAHKTDQVVFPQGQSFLPLEVIDSTSIDTFKVKDKLKLVRNYPLTQFDSGSYHIPRQTIIVNGEGFQTDSFQVRVNDVVVDTTQQNLYPIKPALDIKPAGKFPTWLIWVLAIGCLILIVYFIQKARKKIIEKRRELPPYEKAILSLKKLDEEAQLESGQMKSYYTVLSDAIKRYVDEKIDGGALESTTDEFIAFLRNYTQERKLYLKPQVIDGLEVILKRADLNKFAGIQTDKITAKEDRQTIEENIKQFDQAIPEPTEEEKMLNEAYRAEKERKQKERKTRIRLALGVLIILIGTGIFVGIKGMDSVKNMLQPQSSQKLLNTDWISSEYGALGITLSTPKVLVRNTDSLPPVFAGQSKTEEHFSYGNPKGNLYVEVVNIRFKKDAQVDSIDVGNLLDKIVDPDETSAMTVKNEEFKTAQNRKGQRIFGTFNWEDLNNAHKRKSYTFLVFNERGGIQQLFISYDQDDENAKEIEDRIINSVEFNTQNDG